MLSVLSSFRSLRKTTSSCGEKYDKLNMTNFIVYIIYCEIIENTSSWLSISTEKIVYTYCGEDGEGVHERA